MTTQQQANITVIEEGATTSTELVVALPQDVSLGSVLHIGRHFASSATLTGSAHTTRRATWLTGNNECFAMNGKTPLEAARGLFIDMPDEDEMFPEDYELCDAMDALIEQGIARACLVVHFDNGNPHKVPSWQLLAGASLFVVCEGVPSKSEMLDDPRCRWGVAYAWPRGIDATTGKGMTSALYFTAFIKELMDAGYMGAFAFKFSSYVTDKALACLKAHEYTLRFAAQLRNEADALPYYAYALPIQCSINSLTAGNKDKGGTKQVYYPVPAIPRLTPRDPGAALEFLARMAITADQASVLEASGRVETMVEWSVEKSLRIQAGKDIDENNGADAVLDAGNGAGMVDTDGNVIPMPF